jgi:putative ABC transport system permease protein
MRLSNVAHLYVVRLKAKVVLVQELLAILGIAVGVALMFASQVATTSLNGSVARLASEVVGKMQFQLDARAPRGFDEGLLPKVRALPGVSGVLPVLEREVNLVGPRGQAPVDLVGTNARWARESSPLVRHFSYPQLAGQEALALPAPVAHAIGAHALQPVTVQASGHETTALYSTELDTADIGELIHSPVAIAPLDFAQTLTGMRGRITRIYVHAEPGRSRQVQAGLANLAAGRLNVQPAYFDATLFKVAAAPASQGEGLFSDITALVAFLFAFNAMLLTLPLRQGLIASLRAGGATRADIAQALLFDATMLGSLAALLGLALGDVLSLLVFRSSPDYLSFAFPVGSLRIVTWQSVAAAAAAGVLAACIGVLAPLRGILPGSRRARSETDHVRLKWRIGALAGGLSCVAATTAILIAAPQSAVLGSVILAVALLLLVPLLLDASVAVFNWLHTPFRSASARIVVVELRSRTTRARSIAIAATGAIAVFGSVAIQGAQANLQQGLDRVAHDVASAADLWIALPGTQDLLATTPLRQADSAALSRLPGVRAVGPYRASFLDLGDRHIWVLAPPATAVDPVPPSQLVKGRLALATARLRAGGWAVLSQALATRQGLRIGQSFTLPSPRPMVFRVAALTTNLSWAPGAIILSPDDYVRAWGSVNPSAYNVMLAHGADPQAVQYEIQRALGLRSGLVVETARAREERLRAASRQGLSRLTQIATLVAIATVLAVSVAMATMILQRRQRLARMKVRGYEHGVLWRALLWESGLLLGAGCSIGAVFGVYGQLLISHALASVTGFPVVYTIGALVPIAASVLVSAVALAIVALAGYVAADVAPYA